MANLEVERGYITPPAVSAQLHGYRDDRSIIILPSTNDRAAPRPLQSLFRLVPVQAGSTGERSLREREWDRRGAGERERAMAASPDDSVPVASLSPALESVLG
jgi:hypothetical protein